MELQRGRSGSAVVEELERDAGMLVPLELAPDLARLGEEILGARARAAAGRLGVLAERLVEALEVRVLAERVVEDRRPRAAHPLDEDVHAGDATEGGGGGRDFSPSRLSPKRSEAGLEPLSPPRRCG